LRGNDLVAPRSPGLAPTEEPARLAVGKDLACGDWTSSREGRAQVGYDDRREGIERLSWNSVHASKGCSREPLAATGRAGLFYGFAID
jgi:hypothetical protein